MMNVKETISKLIKDNNTTYEKLAKQLGYKNSSSVCNIRIRNNVSISTLLKITEQLGYKIVLVPTKDRIKNVIVIDDAGKNK